MEKGNILVNTCDDGHVNVLAYLPAPGLAVHRRVDKTEDWTVTHIPSGCAVVSDFSKFKDAMRFCKLVSEMAPWTTGNDGEKFGKLLESLGKFRVLSLVSRAIKAGISDEVIASIVLEMVLE